MPASSTFGAAGAYLSCQKAGGGVHPGHGGSHKDRRLFTLTPMVNSPYTHTLGLWEGSRAHGEKPVHAQGEHANAYGRS